jgi:hypothetical protein
MMFSVKIFNSKDNRKIGFVRAIAKVVKFVKDNSDDEMKILSDSSSFEVVSGGSSYNEGDIVTELLIKKTIVLSKNDFEDESKVISYLQKIDNFCKKANSI